MIKIGHLYRTKDGSGVFMPNFIIIIDYIDDYVIRYTYLYSDQFSSGCPNAPRFTELLIELSSLEMELI